MIIRFRSKEPYGFMQYEGGYGYIYWRIGEALHNLKSSNVSMSETNRYDETKREDL